MSRRRSIFEPIPSYTNAQLRVSVNNDAGRVDRRVMRTHRQYHAHIHSAQQQLPNTANPWAAWAALNETQNGNYHVMMTDAMNMQIIRSFGLNHDNDRRFFFERTGRLSHVIHRARVFLRRRFVKLYEQLCWRSPVRRLCPLSSVPISQL